MDVLGIVFPGQGSQYAGMGAALYEEYKVVRDVFEEANDVLGFDLRKLCFEGTPGQLSKNEIAQPAVVTLSVAAYKAYEERIGIVPLMAAGHSLGEYSALVCAKALKFEDALRIVELRGRLANEATQQRRGCMSIVEGIDYQLIDEACSEARSRGEQVRIACYNAPKQVMLSGGMEAVMNLEDRLSDMYNCSITPLMMNAPFHSELLNEGLVELREALDRVQWGSFQFPVVSNFTSRPYSCVEHIIPNLCDHLVRPVRWLDSLRFMMRYGVTSFVELGPQSVLTNLLGTIANEGITGYAFGQIDDRLRLCKNADNSLLLDSAGVEKLRIHVPSFITRSMANAVCTPNLNWNRDEYEQGVVKPYTDVEHIQEIIESEKRIPSMKELLTSLRMLESVFYSKQVPEEEQQMRYRQILTETGTSNLLASYIRDVIAI